MKLWCYLYVQLFGEFFEVKGSHSKSIQQYILNFDCYPDQEAPSKPREEAYELLHGVVPTEEEEDYWS